jgi:NADH/NAD ratio-sensing transcriptional regulator Rex
LKTIIYSILLSVNFLIGQAQSTKSPSEFWFSLSSKEKISFINGAYSALSVLKKKHKEEVAKQYLNDRNWIEPYYIERYYSLIDEYSSEFVGYDLQLITMHMDALYTNSDNINIPVLEAMKVVSLIQDGKRKKANLRLLQLQRKY